MNINEINQELGKLVKDMTRKATSFREAAAIEDQDIFNKIPYINEGEVYTLNSNTTLDDCPTTMDIEIGINQFFILATKHGKYLVDTEGASYARYIARIITVEI